MPEEEFFRRYLAGEGGSAEKRAYYDAFRQTTGELYQMLPELPFSNIWIASQSIRAVPRGAALELGVSNTMRAWTFFDFPQETYTLANTGCRGIDGAIPTLLGMSLADPERLHFAVMGDLTFFYSFNVLGNRHVGSNIRLMLVNNGCGAEFNIYPHRAYRIYQGEAQRINEFVGAGGHSGAKSRLLVKHYAEDLGFEYLSASTKEEYLEAMARFFTPEKTDRPMLLEAFTNIDEENEALRRIRQIKMDPPPSVNTKIKNKIKQIVGR